MLAAAIRQSLLVSLCNCPYFTAHSSGQGWLAPPASLELSINLSAALASPLGTGVQEPLPNTGENRSSAAAPCPLEPSNVDVPFRV